jgi:hypothetical protein
MTIKDRANIIVELAKEHVLNGEWTHFKYATILQLQELVDEAVTKALEDLDKSG